ncbi:MAG: cytochrome c biogenesis protein ResB [Burkholderiales bacterium]
MSVSTHGLRLKRVSPAARAAVELLSSMRFSISLLSVICIASVIGTVLKQGEPVNNYVNQFGPFWAQVFKALDLYGVYSAWWFLLILAFLVISTSLCVARTSPKIFRDWNVYKENIRAQSLNAFAHKAQTTLAETPQAAAQRIGTMLAGGGWRVKLQERPAAPGNAAGWMVAAKAGAANKLGYIFAHSAIVLICLGGLFDGDLMVRAQTWFNGKSIYAGGGLIADVKPEHRLPVSNPTFRGNLMVAEGERSSTALLAQPTGVLLQDLPFSIELKKFIVEYYSTGMPKLFASEIVIHDKETGAQIQERVEVNHPASYRGIQIYQSSFDDGGSRVKLKAVPLGLGPVAGLAGAATSKPVAFAPFEIEGTVGSSQPFQAGTGAGNVSVELVALRVINVENFGAPGSGSAVDVRKVDLASVNPAAADGPQASSAGLSKLLQSSSLGAALDNRLGAANKTVTKRELRNVGPSITYKLRDAAGQAREFHNYMLPVDTGDGVRVFLLGVRDTPSEAFRYLRVPADAQDSMQDFQRMSAALADPTARERAVTTYVRQAVDPSRIELAQQLKESATRALALFAGADAAAKPVGEKSVAQSGLQALVTFIESRVPEAERPRASEVLVRILNGVLFELMQATRQQAGLAALPTNEATQAFMTQAVLALSDAALYPVPVVLQLQDFTQVQASVFQVAKAPGKVVVYSGCALLILGIFAMLYVRERRLWVWLSDAQGGQARAMMALSSNRKTLDGDREFQTLAQKLMGAVAQKPAA